MLVKGATYIPHHILKEGWRSARHGIAYIVDVEGIRKPHVIGYVTKYLTKSLTRSEKGVRTEERERVSLSIDDAGNVVEERRTYTAELVSKARRIRYSRHFFPEAVAALRTRLFSELEQNAMEQAENQPETDGVQSANDTAAACAEEEQEAAQEQPGRRSSWTLVQREAFTHDIKEYKRRRRKALEEALIDVREGQRHLSGRVISIWAYQLGERRWAG